MAICGNKVYEWSNFNNPQERMSNITQVGVGKANRYALSDDGRLLFWSDDPHSIKELMGNVLSFSAGHSGLLIIRNDFSLWKLETKNLLGFGEAVPDLSSHIANNVLSAKVGDSADYFITREGSLFVKGRAHRGQYGDGRLTSTENFVQTASGVADVVAHTGHALILKQDGAVLGTGGNIYGPLGNHGYGNKAVEWGLILNGASAIATGSSHSLAVKPDRSLWIWGRNEGLEPRLVMSKVDAVAAGNSSTLVLGSEALWQWDTGGKPKMIMKCLN